MTRVQDIATASQTSKKTIYQIFRSKDRLVEELYLLKMQKIGSTAEKIINGKGSFDLLLANYVVLINEEFKYFSFKLVQELRLDYPLVADTANNHLKEAIFNRFQRLLEIGRKEGRMRPDISIEAIMMSYRGALEDFLLGRYLRSLPEDFLLKRSLLSMLVEGLITMFRGILTDEAEKSFNKRISAIDSLKPYLSEVRS
ncbi:MAG: TetR/AcrR family transcriptional regulator [Cyclobacteriaceae bacterium]|nr:TetR/AcrR family transcriptional regulator [Cyclobacteriaceae bacterium HetDA_MAG_MS6]